MGWWTRGIARVLRGDRLCHPAVRPSKVDFTKQCRRARKNRTRLEQQQANAARLARSRRTAAEKAAAQAAEDARLAALGVGAW